MGETMKLAVPTMGEAGLESERAGHFGHCDCFTVVEIADGEITGTSEVGQPSARGRRVHASGRLVGQSRSGRYRGGGHGHAPAHGLQPGGHHGVLRNQTPIVGDAAKLVAAGSVPVMSADNACNHHH